MIGIVILAILIILLVNSHYSPLLKIRNRRDITETMQTTDGSTGIATKGSYNIPYVRIRTELQDMLGL